MFAKKNNKWKERCRIDVPSFISFHITRTHFSLIIFFNFIALYVISLSSFFAWWKLVRRHTPKLNWILSSTTIFNWFVLTFVVVHMNSAVFQFCNDSYILEITDIFVFGALSGNCKHLFFGGNFKHRYCQELLRIKVPEKYSVIFFKVLKK